MQVLSLFCQSDCYAVPAPSLHTKVQPKNRHRARTKKLLRGYVVNYEGPRKTTLSQGILDMRHLKLFSSLLGVNKLLKCIFDF